MKRNVKVGQGMSVGRITSLSDLNFSLISGGAAGDHTVTGIASGDEILAVLHYTTGAALADLTSEFSVSAANTINNTGGTDTTSDQLLVIWFDLT